MEKEELIKIQFGEKEVYANLILCAFEDCKNPATTKLTQDDKFYCDEHGAKEVGNFIKAVAGLGGFV
jgi:hypothetical protein